MDRSERPDLPFNGEMKIMHTRYIVILMSLTDPDGDHPIKVSLVTNDVERVANVIVSCMQDYSVIKEEWCRSPTCFHTRKFYSPLPTQETFVRVEDIIDTLVTL